VSQPCVVCHGEGKIDRLVFRGRKHCWNCDGSGEQQSIGDMMAEAKAGYRDFADDMMDRYGGDYDWGPEFEDGAAVPGWAAERWAAGHAEDEDWAP